MKEVERLMRNLLLIAFLVVTSIWNNRGVRKLARILQTFFILMICLSALIILAVSGIYVLQFILVNFGEGAVWLSILAVIVLGVAFIIEEHYGK